MIKINPAACFGIALRREKGAEVETQFPLAGEKYPPLMALRPAEASS
jgi:hypothetical protein